MKKFYLLSILLIAFVSSFGQEDEKAKSILDQVSEKTRSFEGVQADFIFTMENEEMDIYEKNEGTIKLKGQKYSLDMRDAGMIVYSNGETLWNYMADGNQVTISDIDEESNDLMDPSSLFSIYEKGFQSKFIEEKNEAGKALYIIELFPENDDLDVLKISVAIDKSNMMIHSATLYSTDENLYAIEVLKMETNKSFPDTEFIFDAGKYEDIEVIDFR